MQTYLWFTGLQWALILYWHKAGDGVSALIPHFIPRDDATIDEIKATLRSIWSGLEGGPLPLRICAKPDAPTAKACCVGGPCFEMPNGPEVEELDVVDACDEEPGVGFAEAAAGMVF